MRAALLITLLSLGLPALADEPIDIRPPDVRANVMRLLEQARQTGEAAKAETPPEAAGPVAPTPPRQPAEPVVAEPTPKPARRPPPETVSTHVPVPEMTFTITVDDLKDLDRLEEQLKEAKRRASQKPPVLE